MTQDSPIIGIGASAGSLEALKSLLGTMRADSGAAFVLIQHLDPKHESLIAEILGRSTTMPVIEASDGMTAEANHVYVIPPNAYLTLSGNIFHLSEAVLLHGIRMPIDTFLWSLAKEKAEKAIALIISGTGSDGTLGVRAVKGNGGLVMAQSPDSAQYDGMPRSAIATGLVDYVGPVESMPEVLIEYLRHPYMQQANGSAPVLGEAEEESQLRDILTLLRNRKGFDFRVYKQGTIGRRVARRMGLHRIETMAGYLDYLRENPDEATQLVKDLLIGVTTFFRDPDAFDALNAEVITKIVARKNADEPVRVWVPGCSSGEEAYSIAMLLTEQLETADKHCPLQVFATDIDEEALTVGRTGVYPENIAATLPAGRLRRFFKKENSVYRVTKPLRDSVTFAEQNLISDPPFSKLDLISCRNLLIYLDADVQRKVIALFHFALREGGFLFLGHSETVGQQEDLFAPVVKKWRILKHISVARHLPVEFPVGRARPRPIRVGDQKTAMLTDQVRMGEVTERHLLADYAPAAVLVNEKHQALYFYGPTGRYLDQPTGAPTQDLLSLVRPALRTKLRAALRGMADNPEPVTIADAHVNRDKLLIPVQVTIKPVTLPGTSERLRLTIFEDRPEPSRVQEAQSPATTPETEKSLITQLEYELKSTREELQTNIEEQESANEELQAANEEVMSVNEELQSTNEELETSKEELQSMNEELTTVNSQLKDKVDELSATNDDLANLLNNTNIAILFLDTEMRIRRFTPQTKKLLNLIASDEGRPLADIRQKFSDGDLLADARNVLEDLKPVEREVSTDDDAYYLRRVLPYRTGDNRIGGVVITFIDITTRKRSEVQAQRLAAVVRDSNDAITVQDFDGNILAWNRGAERIFGWTEREALAMNIRDIVPELHRASALAFAEELASGKIVEAFQTHRITKDGRAIDILVAATLLRDDSGSTSLFATTERDVTQLLKTAAALQQSEGTARAYLESAPDAIIIHNLDGTIVQTNAQTEILFGYGKGELSSMKVEQLMPERFRGRHVAHRAKYNANMAPRTMGAGALLAGLKKDGTEFPIEVSLSPINDIDGKTIAAAVRDVTERVRIEDALRKAIRSAETANETKSRFLATASHDLRQPLQSLNLLNESLRKTVADEDAQKMLAMQREALAGMRNLLNSLLDITQLESGSVAPHLTGVPLQEIFDTVSAEFGEQARAKGLNLEIEPTDAVAYSDANLVSQAIQNLVANAIRYTEKGFVRLGSTPDADGLKLVVTDSGIGIPKDELDNIFTEFHQLERDPQERNVGLGLGLAIVQRIAAILDTGIEVETEVGKGSTFSFTLPVGKAIPAGSTSPAVVAEPSTTRTEIVLLIDDEVSVLEASQILLEVEGYEVVPATSPPEAYAKVEDLAESPDIIVTDFHLKYDESGIDIVQAVRKRAGRSVPAILVTGDTSPSFGALNIENVEVLIKPIESDQLINTIQKLLEKPA